MCIEKNKLSIFATKVKDDKVWTTILHNVPYNESLKGKGSAC
jgi:hypothetical protein